MTETRPQSHPGCGGIRPTSSSIRTSPAAIRSRPGTRLVVETEDAHNGSIRTEQDIYPTLASVFERLGGANPVTGPIYVEGVEPGDCVAVTIEDIVPGPVQGQGYTVLSQGLGGLVSSYTLQDGPRADDGDLPDPRRQGDVPDRERDDRDPDISISRDDRRSPRRSSGAIPSFRAPTSSGTSTYR